LANYALKRKLILKSLRSTENFQVWDKRIKAGRDKELKTKKRERQVVLTARPLLRSTIER